MNAAKRASSTSPPHRRPAKTRESCDNCGRQHLKCLPSLEHGLACSYSPSWRPATHYTASSGREALRSTTKADASFDSFLPRIPSRVDPRSSPDISSRHRVNRSYSGSQATGLSPTEHIRPSHATAPTKHIDGVRKTKSSAHSLQDCSQYVTGTEPSNFRSEKVSDACACENNKLVFDVMAEKKLSSGSAPDVDVQGHGTSGQELPVTAGFEDDLNGDLDFDALCVALTPSAFLACMPKNLSDTAPEQDTTTLAQNTDGFSAGTGDNFPSIFSPVPKHCLSIGNPQDTSKGIETCSDHIRTCMISALNILQALHIPPPACLYACDETSMPSPRQPRMIDSVLSTNRDVVFLVSDMLKCTCSLSSQVQLVLTIICGKLMAWYRAMIRNDYDGSDNPSPRVLQVSCDPQYISIESTTRL